MKDQLRLLIPFSFIKAVGLYLYVHMIPDSFYIKLTNYFQLHQGYFYEHEYRIFSWVVRVIFFLIFFGLAFWESKKIKARRLSYISLSSLIATSLLLLTPWAYKEDPCGSFLCVFQQHYFSLPLLFLGIFLISLLGFKINDLYSYQRN